MDSTPIEVVSWDVDGTLYSMSRMKWALLALALRQPMGAMLRELKQLQRVRREMALVRGAGGKLTAAPPRDLSLEEKWYGAALARIGLRPGLREVIDTLRARGLRQVVLSDYRSEYKLAALGLKDTFSAVYAGESFGWLKPAPELYRAWLAELKVEPERVLHIGDRLDTDGAAAGLGCRVAILGRDWRTPADLLRALSPARDAK